MALNLKFIKKWNALHISMNGKNNGKIMSDYYRFLDGIPEKVFPDNYSVFIPSTYLKDYLNKFEYCTTTNQTIKSMLGTEETIVPNITYQLKHLDKMKLKPYPFQEVGSQFLVGEKCGIIGDEVGLGKTIQALGAINELLQEKLISKILIVMPASLKYQWQDEISKFTPYSSFIVEGTAKKREKQYTEFINSTDEIMIVGYETLRIDINIVKEMPFDCVVLDEAHKIGNRKTKTHDAIMQLQSEYRFALTGTPMQNKPQEIFGLMSWIDKGVFGGVTNFNKRHILVGEKYGKQWVELGYRYLDEIREKVSPKMLRRLKKEVAPDLPDIIETVVRVDMNKPQKTLYEAINEDIQLLQAEIKDYYENQSDEDKNKHKRHPKEDAMLGYLYMQQALSDHPLLLLQGDSKMVNKYKPLIKNCKTSPKLEALIEQVGIFLEQDSKIVIFSRYVRMLVFIREKLMSHYDEDAYMIHGDISAKERNEQLKDFRTNPNRNIMLLSDAGNAGLNIEFSDILINYDSPWSLSSRVQRNGRIHRISSTFDKVTVMDIVTNGTIDETILKTVQRKEELNSGLIENTEEEISIMNDLLKNIIEKN